MAKDTRKKEYNVVDETGVVSSALIEKLLTKGSARLWNFGRFKVISVKGRSRYDFKKRKMVPVPEFKQVIFRPSSGLQEMLRKDG